MVSYYDSSLAIVEYDTLLTLVQHARAQGESIVMTNGCFDLLHEGHIHCLDKAKQLGSRLIVAVNSDNSVSKLKGNDRPVKSLSERMTILGALKAVDWVVSFDDDTPERLIQAVTPDVLVKGGDWQQQCCEIVGSEYVKAHGGQVKLINYCDGYSTTELIHSIRGEIV
jgi:D-beta-D-heptose 7-phosphate kinase/D-beta-D-heptose 1-phosphate adenosyltransferase